MVAQTYGFNGSAFNLQPTTGKWLPRSIVDFSGNGHPIYSDVLSYELRWQLSSPEDLWEFHKMYSGTFSGQHVVVSLPRWGYPDYIFQNYSGCSVSEPEYNVYFSEHVTEVKQYIYRIRV